MVKKIGKEYKFIVDCHADHCKEIRTHMRNLDFSVKRVGTCEGDHYGIKHFDSDKDAELAANSLFEKFAKGTKLYRLTVEM